MSETPLPLAVITAAIIKTRKDVGTLGKAAVNPHGNYKYVSIDKYYEVVASAAAKNGLFWTISEVKSTLNPNIGKTGVLDATYTITMYHESGAVAYEFSRITMVHPIQGAQTVGSAMSYVDKVFMRQIFAVSTGEEDADATNPEDVKLEKPDYGAIERLMIPGVEMAESREELKKFWSENSNSLDTLKLGDKAAYGRVVEAFKTRNQKLKD
jgi:hypothetical protein